jgi:hypothetical protein
MAVPEEEFLLPNKDDQEKWLLLDLDASPSDAVSSKDCTPTMIVLLHSHTEHSLLLCFCFGNLDSNCCSFKG